jgi:hypothetical protein
MLNYLNVCHCCRSVLKLYIKDRRDSDHIAVVYSSNAGYVSFLILRVCVILIVEKPTVKCSTKYIISNFVLNLFTDIETAIATNRELKKSIMCIRCHTNEKCMLFVNCGHRVTCESCSNQIDYCPYCDVKIKSKLKTFLS